MSQLLQEVQVGTYVYVGSNGLGTRVGFIPLVADYEMLVGLVWFDVQAGVIGA